MLMEPLEPTPQTKKSPVKLFVSRRLRDLGLGRIGLSESMGKSLSYLSQIESGTTHFPTPMVEAYDAFLELGDIESDEFRKLVALQNAERRIKGASSGAARLAAVLETRGSELSDEALAEMFRIVEAELKRIRTSPLRKARPTGGPERMSPERFVQIVNKIASYRREVCGSLDGMFPIITALEHADAWLDDFDLQVVDRVPARFGDVWATVETVGVFRTLYLPEDMYRRAEKAAAFERHVLAHEITHVILAHQGLRNLAPSVISGRRTTALLRDDPAEELEANVGAVLLLLGWERLFRPLAPDQRTTIYDLHRIERSHAERVYYFLQQSRVQELIHRAIEGR